MFTSKKTGKKVPFLRKKNLETPEDAIKRLGERWDVDSKNSIVKGGMLVSKDASIDDLNDDTDTDEEEEG